MADEVVTVLTVNARGAEVGSAAFVAAMKAAQAGVDRTLNQLNALNAAVNNGGAVMQRNAQRIESMARAWDRLRTAVDPVAAAYVKHEQDVTRALSVTDAALKRLGVTQEAVNRVREQAIQIAERQMRQATAGAPAPLLPFVRLSGASAADSARAMEDEFDRMEEIAKQRAAQVGREFGRSLDEGFRIGVRAVDMGATFSALDAEMKRLEELSDQRARQVGQEFGRSLNESFRIGVRAVDLGASFSALDDEMKRLEEMSEQRARQAGQEFGRALNESFGIGVRAVDMGATFSALDAEMKRLETLAAQRASQIGHEFGRALNESLRIGISATSGGATFSALDEMMRQQEMIAKARADANAVNAQQGINASFGIGGPRATDLGATTSALEEQAAEVERLTRRYVELRPIVDGAALAQERLNKSLADNRAMVAAGIMSIDQLAAANIEAERVFRQTNATLPQMGQNARLSAFEITNLGMQFNDVAVMMASGQNPFVMIMQQGMQMAQILQMSDLAGKGMKNTLLELGRAARIFLTNPVTLWVAGFAALAGAVFFFARQFKTAVEPLEDILSRHEDIIKRLKIEYGELGKASEQSLKRDPAFTDADVRKQQADLVKAQLAELRTSMDSLFPSGGIGGREQSLWERIMGEAPAVGIDANFEAFRAPIERLDLEFKEGRPNVKAFVDEVARIQQTNPNVLDKWGNKLRDMAAAALEAQMQLDAVTREANREDQRGRDRQINRENANDVARIRNERIMAREDTIRNYDAEIQSIRAITVEERIAAFEATERAKAMEDRVVTAQEELEIQAATNAMRTEIDQDIKNGIRERKEAMDLAVAAANAELVVVGKSVGEATRLTTEFQMMAEAIQAAKDAYGPDGLVSPEEAARIQAAAEALGKLAQQLSVANVASDLAFEASMIGKSPMEQDVASRLRSIYGDSSPDQVVETQMRINAQMQEFNDIVEGMPVTQLQRAAEFQENLNAAVESGRMSADTAADVWRHYKDELDAGPIDEVSGAFDDFAKSVVTGSETIGEAFKNLATELASMAWDEFVSKPLRDAFRNIAGSLMQKPEIIGGDTSAITAVRDMSVQAATVYVSGFYGSNTGNMPPIGVGGLPTGPAGLPWVQPDKSMSAAAIDAAAASLYPGSNASRAVVGGTVQQMQSGATRDMPITPELNAILAQASALTGLVPRVTSGGQPTSGPNRVGSHRHDIAPGSLGAADLNLFDPTLGRMLDMTDPADQLRMFEFMKLSVAGGATGVGAGVGYMGRHTMHIGGGSPAFWGQKGHSAPPWVRDAWTKGMAMQANPFMMPQVGDAIQGAPPLGSGSFLLPQAEVTRSLSNELTAITEGLQPIGQNFLSNMGNSLNGITGGLSGLATDLLGSISMPSGGGGGGLFNSLLTFGGEVFTMHGGGMVGRDGHASFMNLSAWDSAASFHGGRFGPRERPVVLEDGEIVISNSQQREARNSAARSGTRGPVQFNQQIINQSGADVETKETEKANGDFDMQVIIKKAKKEMVKEYGLRKPVGRR